MNIISQELVEKILENGEEIGEGSTRKVVEYNGKIYKIAFEDFNDCNESEIDLYLSLKDEYTFLNKIYSYSEDYRVIEIEPLNCDFISDFAEELEGDSCIPVYMEELIDYTPEIKETIDFNFNLVTEFIEMNDLDPTEIFLPFQWGINKEGKLKLSDYSR